MSLAPCTNGPRHKWEFVKNVNVGSMSVTARGTVGRFSLKGLYRCACGAKKHGQFNHNASDLRSEIDSQYPAGYMQQRGAA